MRYLLSCVSLIVSGAVHAVPVEWTLQDVTFEDGSMLTGSFIFDADAPADQVQRINPDFAEAGSFNYSLGYLSFDFALTSATGSEIWFNPGRNASVDYTMGAQRDYYLHHFHLYSPASDETLLHLRCPEDWCLPAVFGSVLSLEFSAPLTNAGGEIAVSGYFLADGGISIFDRYSSDITGGAVVANVVPIPAAVLLFASALGLLGWRSRYSR